MLKRSRSLPAPDIHRSNPIIGFFIYCPEKTKVVKIKRTLEWPTYKNVTSAMQLGNGCGAGGRAVTSYTSDLQIESNHRQNFIHYQLYQNCIGNTKIMKRLPSNCPLTKMSIYGLFFILIFLNKFIANNFA